MSDEVPVRLVGVGKMYKVFPSPMENLLDALGLTRLLPWGKVRYREFWALRGIDLELRRGQRMGIIGRNGAGKTTLLKLLTGNLAPTEGRVETRGLVDALLDMGGGLHPEFTGYENIRAALTYRGLDRREIAEAEAEIAEFTELGEFLAQPFKTYSLGMQSRLALAIATTARPDILIVDEILGTGDAYFFSKSTERMMRLVESGATVLIVSHALDQIVRFCHEAIWIDRGRVAMRGPSVEVCKAYENFIRVLENRRLKGRSRKLRARRYTQTEVEHYTDQLVVRVTFTGEPGDRCDVAEVVLWKDDEIEDRVLVGGPQDADILQSAFVVTDRGAWSAPRHGGAAFFRTLEGSPRSAGSTAPGSTWGDVLVYLWAFFEEARYEVEVRYRCLRGGALSIDLVPNGVRHTCAAVPVGNGDWVSARVVLDRLPAGEGASRQTVVTTVAGDRDRNAEGGGVGGARHSGASRWLGDGGLTIEEVVLVDGAGHERAVFETGTPLSVRVTLMARRSGSFEVIPAALVFRADGIVVTRHVGERTTLELALGERIEARLSFGPLLLGNGHYLLSVGIYRNLDVDVFGPPDVYDYFDRSYVFQVVGNPRLHNELVRHPGSWRFEPAVARVRAAGGARGSEASER